MRYFVALAYFLVTQVPADSWPAATVAAFASPTGKIVVRVVPGSNLDAVFGFEWANKGERAKAIVTALTQRRIIKKFGRSCFRIRLHPFMPQSPTQVGLPTLGNWHNVGREDEVMVVYSAEGKIARRYRLTDIYTDIDIGRFEQSISSIWWRCPSQPVFELRSDTHELTDALGATVSISLKTGAIARTVTSQKGC